MQDEIVHSGTHTEINKKMLVGTELFMYLMLQSGMWINISGLESIYMLGMAPDSGEWANGETFRFASNAAIDHINSRNDILPGYNLNIIWVNSQVGLLSQFFSSNFLTKVLFDREMEMVVDR